MFSQQIDLKHQSYTIKGKQVAARSENRQKYMQGIGQLSKQLDAKIRPMTIACAHDHTESSHSWEVPYGFSDLLVHYYS